MPNMFGAMAGAGRAMNPVRPQQPQMQRPQKGQGIGPSPNAAPMARMAQGLGAVGGAMRPSLGGGDPMNQKLAPLPQGPQGGQLGQAINPQLNQMMNMRNQALGGMQAGMGMMRPPQMQEGGQMVNNLGLQPMQQDPREQEMMRNRIQQMMGQMGQQQAPQGIGPSAAPMQQAQMPQRKLFGRR